MRLYSTKLHSIKKGFIVVLYIINTYSENFPDFQKLVKNKYSGHSILLLESICEVENKYYPQTFLDKFFECNSVENSVNRLFKELVQIVDWSDNES